MARTLDVFLNWRLGIRLEQALAVRVSGIVRGMDESSPGWKLVSPVVLANCGRVFSLGRWGPWMD